jgi:hypothetical protein
MGSVRVLRVPAATFHSVVRCHPALQTAWLDQLQAKLADVRLVAACNARHSIATRSACWLARLQDHLGSELLPITHEGLARILGVRRAGITVALQALQRQGVLCQSRGGLTIVDPARLRQCACSCLGKAVLPSGTRPALPTDPQAWIGVTSIRPRGLLEAAIRNHMSGTFDSDDANARRNAALHVCRTIIAQTESMLAS